MIRFGNHTTEKLVRSMWKICFEDSDTFINLQFSRKYKNENTLIFFEKEEAVASLQMFPYTIVFYGKKIPFYYLAGLCTLPQHRKKGYMAQLIHKSHQIMKERNIPLSVLVPAEEWLFGFYAHYGYEQVFEKDDKPILLKKLLESYPDIQDAYKHFNESVTERDFYVQKTFEDFHTIIEESRIDNFVPKYNLSAMARIIDPFYLLKLYAAHQERETNFRIKINSPENSLIYHIRKQEAIIDKLSNNFDIEADIKLLCRLLFGYKTQELPPPYPHFFPQHHPVINLMLE